MSSSSKGYFARVAEKLDREYSSKTQLYHDRNNSGAVTYCIALGEVLPRGNSPYQRIYMLSPSNVRSVLRQLRTRYARSYYVHMCMHDINWHKAFIVHNQVAVASYYKNAVIDYSDKHFQLVVAYHVWEQEDNGDNVFIPFCVTQIVDRFAKYAPPAVAYGISKLTLQRYRELLPLHHCASIIQGVEEAARLGWSESRRRFFLPDVQRWADGFLATVRLAARSGHPSATSRSSCST
jgi:hypothetical protein